MGKVQGLVTHFWKSLHANSRPGAEGNWSDSLYLGAWGIYIISAQPITDLHSHAMLHSLVWLRGRPHAPPQGGYGVGLPRHPPPWQPQKYSWGVHIWVARQEMSGCDMVYRHPPLWESEDPWRMWTLVTTNDRNIYGCLAATQHMWTTEFIFEQHLSSI